MKKNRLSFLLIGLVALLLFSTACRGADETNNNRAGAALPTGLPNLPSSLNGTALPPLASLGGAHWIVEIDILQSLGIASSAADLTRQVKGLMPSGVPLQVSASSGSSPNGAVYTLRIEGDNTDVMRLIIYDLLSPIVDVSSQPMELTLAGAVSKGSSLAVIFSGIPSTGAQFLVDGLGSFFTLKSSGYECESVGPGGQNTQTLLLEALKNGTALLKFFYQRAWEEVLQYFPVRITIEADGLKGTFDLSDPSMFLVEMPEFEGEQVLGGAMPGSFDWSTSNNSTGAPQISAVKNQQSCGSCWAFATVGVMEGVMMIHGAGEKDLSEQYLVSCNTDGWSCNGGWDVHEYHINKNGKSSNQPGAVMEAAMPYSNSNGTCQTINDHPYLLTSRHSVENTVESLKNALYNYGPVWTTVCAKPLQSYSGGVITESDCSQVDHAVVLVGWDDSTESWKVKNSWGTGWGESGYFRIKWGVSGIGQYSNYVVYGGEDVSPKDATPTFTPTPVPDEDTTPTLTPTPVSGDTETPIPDDETTLTETPVPAATETPKNDDEDDAEEEGKMTPTSVPQNNVLEAGFYDDNMKGVFTYGGEWFLYEGKEPFKKTTHFSYSTGSTVRFQFEGVRFFIGYTADRDQGVMKVVVDQKWVFYVNQYNTKLEWQKLWQSVDFAFGVHTVEITHAGSRQIDLDYVVIE